MSTDAAHGADMPHLPFYVTAPGSPDYLYMFVGVLLVVGILLVLVFYLNLHALPERMAHSANHTQLQVVALMTLIALLTHSEFFWIAALLLAAVKFPDFLTPIRSIAQSLERLSGGTSSSVPDAAAEEAAAPVKDAGGEGHHA